MTKKEIGNLLVKCTRKTGLRRYRLADEHGNAYAENCDPGFLLAIRREMFGTATNRALVELDLDKAEPFVKPAGWYEAQGLK